MNKQELDQFIDQYGFSNETDIEDMQIAMTVTKVRKDRENG